MKIDTFDYLLLNDKTYVGLKSGFIQKLRREIKNRYKTLSNYHRKKLAIKLGTFKYMFKKYAQIHHFQRIVKMSNDVGISKEEVYKNIIGFRFLGSRKEGLTKISRKLAIDEEFIEGYALYLAEGDTGFSGKTKPRKLRFTNSELYVIKHFIAWTKKYFPDLEFYIQVIIPSDTILSNSEKENISHILNIFKDRIKFSFGSYNKKLKYRVCVDRAIIIDLFLAIENIVKEFSTNNSKLVSAYIRGMMIGEGTAYINKYFYVKLEMRNEKEVKFLAKLLDILKIKYTIKERGDRPGIWTIFIGRKDSILTFNRLVGFGIHKKRQLILDRIVDSISINPDVAVQTKLLVARLEKK